MSKALARLFAHYRDYHAYGPPRLKYMGYLGVASLVIFYFLRFTRPNAQLFDDIGTRGTAIVMLALLALKDRWPQQLKRYYIPYSYVAVLYCLPCFTVLVALQRGGGMPAISNAFISLCFLVLLTDWRNTLFMLAMGSAMATAMYVATTPDPRLPLDLMAQLPAFAIIVLGGNLFKFSTEQIDAERKLRATQALAGSIAHEMRTPLVQMKHNLQGMQQALPPPTTTGQPQTLGPQAVNALYRYVAQSEIAVKRGLQVIEMTLDEVSAKPLDTAGFAYLSAAEATGKAVHEYGYESDDARAKVDLNVIHDFTFHGDETAYLFVVFNLLKNSLYYLALYPETRITITVDRHEVSVRDNGPGIAPDVLVRLFEPFRSVGKAGGTGLGLAYCQRVMRAFGGQITCDSVVGEFTDFSMRFPPVSKSEGEAHRAEVLGKAQAVFRGKRLLVVDDDPTLRLTTRHKLQPLGAIIDDAANGKLALELLLQHRYDLVVLDLNMPVLDGYAVAEQLRLGAAPVNRNVCIVAYTSELAHVASVKTFKAGMDGFVSKPCSQVPLLQALLLAFEHPLTRARSTAAVLAGRKVLLADDNTYSRKAVAGYLRHAGVKVVEASHGQEVLDLLGAGEDWDGVLLDINMPGMDGLETARAIRSGSSAIRNVPIIALTAHSDAATNAAARVAGMDDFITKPVDAPLLYEKLNSLLLRLPAASRPLGSFPAVNLTSKPDDRSALVDLHRLQGFRQIGMLEELVNDYLPEIAGLVSELEQSHLRQDLTGSLDILHSLLGMTGEAGAIALHRQIRLIYVPLLEESRWPDDPEWMAGLKLLEAQTGDALRASLGAGAHHNL